MNLAVSPTWLVSGALVRYKAPAQHHVCFLRPSCIRHLPLTFFAGAGWPSVLIGVIAAVLDGNAPSFNSAFRQQAGRVVEPDLRNQELRIRVSNTSAILERGNRA